MQKIPKIIHYCWFGYGQKNDVTVRCLKSWRKYLPDYQVKVWDELSFDVNCNQFVQEAYSQKKWAFIADYVRLYVLFNEGGIYLDSDIEVFRPLDKFLEHSAFTGFQDNNSILTGTLGAAKGNRWIRRLLDYYQDRLFIKSDGTLDLRPNPDIVTEISLNEYGLQLNNQYQVLKEDVHIYPKEYFCIDSGVFDCYTKHHFNGSWAANDYKREALLYKKMYTLLVKLLSVDNDILISRLQALNLLSENIAFLEFDVILNVLYQRLRQLNQVNLVGCVSTGMVGNITDIPIIGLQDLQHSRIDTLIIATMLNVRYVKQQLGGLFTGKVISVEDLLDDYILF